MPSDFPDDLFSKLARRASLASRNHCAKTTSLLSLSSQSQTPPPASATASTQTSSSPSPPPSSSQVTHQGLEAFFEPYVSFQPAKYFGDQTKEIATKISSEIERAFDNNVSFFIFGCLVGSAVTAGLLIVCGIGVSGLYGGGWRRNSIASDADGNVSVRKNANTNAVTNTLTNATNATSRPLVPVKPTQTAIKLTREITYLHIQSASTSDLENLPSLAIQSMKEDMHQIGICASEIESVVVYVNLSVYSLPDCFNLFKVSAMDKEDVMRCVDEVLFNGKQVSSESTKPQAGTGSSYGVSASAFDEISARDGVAFKIEVCARLKCAIVSEGLMMTGNECVR